MTERANSKYVYVLRTCDANGRSRYGTFQYPESGIVKAPDWDPAPNCGGGLHGWLWGEGDGSLGNWNTEAKWLVVKVFTSKIVDLNGKVKFPRGRVVFYGDRTGATAFIQKRRPGAAVIGGTSTSGDDGTSTSGDYGTSTSGDYGTSTSGYGGTSTSGVGGTIVLSYWDYTADRKRLVIGYIGENGLKPGVKYKLDADHRLVEA